MQQVGIECKVSSTFIHFMFVHVKVVCSLKLDKVKGTYRVGNVRGMCQVHQKDISGCVSLRSAV